MAKFGEIPIEYKEVSKFTRIPITCVGDQWFVIIRNNSVVNVQESRSLHTWTLLQGHINHFTAPVAYFKEKLYSVMNEKILIRWPTADDDLENAEKVMFQENIYTIINLDECPPLLIFASGKCAIVDPNDFCNLRPFDDIKLKKNDSFIWVDAAVSATSTEVFYLAFNKKTKCNTLYYFSVDNENKSVSLPSTFSICHENSSLKSCCLNYQVLTFFSLWSDGTVRCFNVKDATDIFVLSVENVTIETIVDVCSVDDTHITIAKGESEKEECVLEVWDTKKAILKGSKLLKTAKLVSLQVAASSNYLFINFSFDKLLAVPFFVDVSFASTLNTSKAKDFQQHSWSSELELLPIPAVDELEKMDTSLSDQDSENPVELIVEKLLNGNSPDLKFIPESEIVKMLQLVISHKTDEDQTDFDKNMYILLNFIFSSSFNDALLVKYLKSLNVKITLIVLDLLLSYLKQKINIPAEVVERPSDLQIVNWICLMISSHTEALLFTKEKATKKLLKDLKKTLSTKMEEFEDLKGLQSYFSILQKKDILPQHYSVEKYCIETLDI